MSDSASTGKEKTHRDPKSRMLRNNAEASCPQLPAEGTADNHAPTQPRPVDLDGLGFRYQARLDCEIG